MGKETALRIQKAAISGFKEKGYQSVTIDEICKLAGITKSTFYYHFQSKDQLLLDFYKNTIEISAENMQLLATSENCWQKLWACVEPSIDWTIEADSVIISQVLISSIQNSIDIFSKKSGYEELLKIMESIIILGQQTGQFLNTSNAKALVENIRCSSIGIALIWCIEGGSFDKKLAVKKSIISLLCVREDLISK